MAKNCFIPSSIGIYLILAHLLAITMSEIIPYYQHYLEPLSPEYLTIPKFAPMDAPNWAPGRGRSYIDLSRITLHNDCKVTALPSGAVCANSTFEILMFEEPGDQYWMDYWPENQFCCTPDMVAEGDCVPEDVNTLINPVELPGSFLRTVTVLPDVPMTLDQDGVVAHHDIKKSGIYILFMGVCDPNSAKLRIAGSIDSLDPYGYLPADLFGNLPFYGALSLLYTVVGIVWLVFCVFHSENLMPLQFWITLVLALGMIETTVLFFQYLKWNDYGSLSIGVTFFALLFGVLKRAVSRVVVLLVTLGYGVVRPTLGSQMGKVLLIGLSYFVLSLYYTVFNSLPARNKQADDPYNNLFSLCLVLLAGVDTTFYCWVFLSINNILSGLAARKQAAKYLLYRNFRVVLFISLSANFVWILYGSAIRLNTDSGEDSNWKDRWTVDALWESTYFLIFLSIAIMWAPSRDFTKYAFSEELSQLDDDSEYQTGLEMDLQSPNDGNKNGDNDDDAEYGGRLNDEKKCPGPTVQLINGVRHLSSPWPVSTDSSLYFSPSPVKYDEDNYISPFDIMSPSQSRENEMTVALSKELSGLIQAGDIDGLTITVAKWRLHYKDIRVENTPLLHLAVIGDHFQMVKFLISKGVDLHIIDQAGRSAFDYAASCRDLSIYPYLKTAIASDQASLKIVIEPIIETGPEIDDSNSSVNSLYQTSYLSSMEVKKLNTRKENKLISKKIYRESNCTLLKNHDGEESVDDDNSPRKEKRVTYTSRLVSEQVLSPLSQSSTETSYSSILQSENILFERQQKDLIPNEESTQEEIANAYTVDTSEELNVSTQLMPEELMLADESFGPQVVFSECQSPKILGRSLSSSTFITAKSTAKSPFKNMRKAAGRAFSFVAGGKVKKEKTKKGEVVYRGQT